MILLFMPPLLSLYTVDLYILKKNCQNNTKKYGMNDWKQFTHHNIFALDTKTNIFSYYQIWWSDTWRLDIFLVY